METSTTDQRVMPEALAQLRTKLNQKAKQEPKFRFYTLYGHLMERRVDGHLWITVIAYHLMQQCLYQLKQRGIQYEWKTVRKIIRSRVRVTTQAKMENGSTLYLRSSTKAEGEQLKVYKALGISSQILGPRKTVL